MPLSLELAEVRDFLEFLELKGLAAGTRHAYRRALEALFQDCSAELDQVAQITPAQLRGHIRNLQARGLTAQTVKSRVQSLKRFFGFLVAEGHLKTDPAQRLPLPKIEKRLPKALSLAEMEALLHAVRKASPFVLRDRVLIELLYAGGLTIREVLRLRVEDCDLEDGRVRVIGLGDNERRIFLKPPVLQRLREYIEGESLSGLLFPARDGEPVDADFVRQRLRAYAQAAGITHRVTPQVLRQSGAVHYLQGGAPINFVQSLLGHASLATTVRYLQLSDEIAKRIVLNTETAVDGLRGEAKQGTKQLKDRPWGYRVNDFEMWDAYVRDVLEWLARG